MRLMNRETSFSSSDTLVVVDRSTRRRNIIIAAVVGIAALVAAFFAIEPSLPHVDADLRITKPDVDACIWAVGISSVGLD